MTPLTHDIFLELGFKDYKYFPGTYSKRLLEHEEYPVDSRMLLVEAKQDAYLLTFVTQEYESIITRNLRYREDLEQFLRIINL